jgi:hypothetical protein
MSPLVAHLDAPHQLCLAEVKRTPRKKLAFGALSGQHSQSCEIAAMDEMQGQWVGLKPGSRLINH